MHVGGYAIFSIKHVQKKLYLQVSIRGLKDSLTMLQLKKCQKHTSFMWFLVLSSLCYYWIKKNNKTIQKKHQKNILNIKINIFDGVIPLIGLQTFAKCHKQKKII